MAGSSRSCECGATVLVPSLSGLQAKDMTDTTPPLVPEFWSADETTPEPGPRPELIAPTAVALRTERGAKSDRRAPVMAALTPDALWIQDTWRLRSLALHGFEIERRRNG